MGIRRCVPRGRVATDTAPQFAENHVRNATGVSGRLLLGLPDGLRDEGGDVFCVLTLDEVGGHLAVAASASVLDRVEHEVLRWAQLVEIWTDPRRRLRRRQRVAVPAALAEE